jgi:hypothetical protein
LGVGLLFRFTAGPVAMVAGVAFGLLATVLQTVAVGLSASKIQSADYQGLLMRWGAGAGLRMLGVVIIPIAVVADRALFPPLWSALGYVAVLVPLFFLEIRRFR